MIFVFAEDGSLEVVEDIEVAGKTYDGADVQSGVFQFYDEYGRYLEPRFIAPTIRTRRIFGMFTSFESEIFDLAPMANADMDTIGLCLHEARFVKSNRWFDTLDDVRQFFKTRGVSLALERNTDLTRQRGNRVGRDK